MEAAGLVARQQQAVALAVAQHLLAGAQLGKGGEDAGDDLAYLHVGVQRHTPIREPDQAGRQMLHVGAALHLAQAPRIQALAQQIEFGFRHGPFEPEQEPVVIQPRVVDALDVGDERAPERRQVEQMLPVGVVARQPRNLPAEDDPDVPEGHLAREGGKRVASGRAGARLAQVPI